MSPTEFNQTLKWGRIRCNSFPFDVQHSRNDPKILRREGIIGEFHFQSSTKDTTREREAELFWGIIQTFPMMQRSP